MDERNLFWVFRKQLGYALICFVLILLHLVPLNQSPERFPPPDLLLALTTALIVRRALFAPYWMVGLVFLFADIVMSKPLGLWSLIVVAGMEIVRANRLSFREMFFLTEWAILSVVFAVMFFSQQVLLTMTFTPTLPVKGLLWQLLFTILVYPLAVFFVSNIMRIYKPSPGEANALGHRT